PLLDDNLVGETSPETVKLLLTHPGNATLGVPHTATLNINEDADTPPTIQFSASTFSANEGSLLPAAIQVTRSTASASHVTVHYAPSTGRATAGVDYTAASGTLTIPAGQTSGTFSVPILDDELANETSPETVNLTLSSPTNATLGTPSTATLN